MTGGKWAPSGPAPDFIWVLTPEIPAWDAGGRQLKSARPDQSFPLALGCSSLRNLEDDAISKQTARLCRPVDRPLTVNP